MHLRERGRGSLLLCPHWTKVVGALSFITLALGGLLALSLCATSEAGLKREEGLYLVLSNSLATARVVAPGVPPPTGTMVEGVLGVGGALLALWATHLQRSLRDLKTGNGGSNGGGMVQSPPGAGPAATAAQPAASQP